MKTTTIVKVVTVTSILFVNNLSVNAQFFKKLGKAIEKTAKTVESTANALDEVSKAADATPSTASSLTDGGTAAASDSVSIAWDKIPVFSAKRVNMTDENGNPVLLEDGTQDYRVLLVDQFGNKRSAQSVKAQIDIINQRVLAILAKVGLGAGIGALQNGLSGAAVGAGMGALASIDDISMAKKQKKSLKQQKILLAEYQKNFTEEGKPINAKVDPTKLEGLDLKEDNALSMTAADIKKELESEDFNSTDTSSWEGLL
jgi:hypothetical protein